jgi:hypothetical protein
VVSSRPPNLQKTKEKLKNPQQPNTQALESQEGLKLIFIRYSKPNNIFEILESQEGLKQPRRGGPVQQVRRLEFQEGLKHAMIL